MRCNACPLCVFACASQTMGHLLQKNKEKNGSSPASLRVCLVRDVFNDVRRMFAQYSACGSPIYILCDVGELLKGKLIPHVLCKKHLRCQQTSDFVSRRRVCAAGLYVFAVTADAALKSNFVKSTRARRQFCCFSTSCIRQTCFGLAARVFYRIRKKHPSRYMATSTSGIYVQTLSPKRRKSRTSRQQALRKHHLWKEVEKGIL